MNKRKPGPATRATPRGRTSRSTPPAGAEHKTGGGSFAVAAECTVADASALKAGLAKLVDESDAVTLDVGAIQRIDTAGLQVIATFIRERESQGRQVRWHGYAPALASAVKLLGLGDLFKLPTSVPAPAARAVETAR
jgi:phospholipid transport system transporter-binding protein